MFINVFRMLILFVTIFIVYNYKKNKILNKLINKYYNYILASIIILFSILVIILYNNVVHNVNVSDHYTNEYKEALMSGKLSFDIDGVDIKKFEELDNVYDFTQRGDLTYKAFDTSYYNGKFYMYFGILPALLMGITKLSLISITCLFSILGVIFSVLFIDLLIDRYCHKASKTVKLLLIIYFLFNSRLLLLIPTTRFYELLVISGYSLCMVGLYLYMKFYNNKKNIYLFFGSLFLSLSLMCRPNMIIVFIFAFFLVYKKINKKNFIYCFSPYIIIGLVLMYLNYIRFGNIFDFGIKYQIGIIDNSYSKFNLTTAINGILGYLFRIPVINNTFPYIYNSVLKIPYNGFYYNTSIGNGIVVMSVLGLILPFMNNKIDNKNKKLFIISIICGIILLLLNNTAGGFVKRYTLEFAWLFLIPIIISSIKAFKNKKGVLFVLVIISCLINFLVIFDTEKDDVSIKMNNKLYYYLKYF